MSILGSLFIANTALDAFSNSINVAGDNIANLNTIGFKTSQLTFADLFPTVSGAIETGHGVRLANVSKPLQQGAFETTRSVTDLAVDGNGFFVVSDPASGTAYYTRAGQFHLDASGKMVNELGFALQGNAGDISIGSSLTVPGQPTTSLALTMDLDAAATIPAVTVPPGPDASSGAWLAASNFSTVATIFDSLGNAHDLSFVFRKTAPNSWQYQVLAPASALDAGAANSLDLRQVAAPGSLIFDASGQLDPASSSISDISGLTWLTGGSQTLPAGNLSFAGTVQYAQPSSVSTLTQDGFRQGSFTGINIDGQGGIVGRYSNGVSQVLGNLVLANFANVDDLDPQGSTLYLPTAASGAAQTGAPGQGGLGAIVSGALELSTVDLAREFVMLITSQRSFQVNSRIITTADEMYSVAANLKS